MVFVVSHRKLSPNYFANAGAVPKLPAQAICFGPVGKQLREELFLLLPQFRRRPGARLGTQPFLSEASDALHPLAHGSLCDPKRFSYFFVGPAVAFEFEAAPTTLFFPIWMGTVLFHAHVLSIDFRFSYLCVKD